MDVFNCFRKYGRNKLVIKIFDAYECTAVQMDRNSLDINSESDFKFTSRDGTHHNHHQLQDLDPVGSSRFQNLVLHLATSLSRFLFHY
jgi:hypothetical protein